MPSYPRQLPPAPTASFDVITVNGFPLTFETDPDPQAPNRTVYSLKAQIEGQWRVVAPIVLPLLLLLLWPVTASAATRTVCATGCTHATIQAAVNAAVSGDVVVLETGRTFVESVILKKFTGCSATNPATWVTIRSGVTSTGTLQSTSLYPAPNIRLPDYATSSYASLFAKIQSSNDSLYAIDTDTPPNVTGCWELKWLDLKGRPAGLNAIVRLGNDSRSTQMTKADIPGPFKLTQLYIHGDPVKGQFRGIANLSRGLVIRDSRIWDIKSQAEGQVIWTNSTDDAGSLINNYIEGGAETVLFGGGAGCCRPLSAITVTSATSASAMTFSTHTDLQVGQGISVVNAVGNEEYAEIASCGTAVAGADCTSNTVTITPALSAQPLNGAVVEWGLVPKNFTATYNYITRPIGWRSPILSTPQGVTANASTTSGSLPAGTYAYRIVAKLLTSSGQTALSTASAEVTATLTAPGSVTISWTAVPNAENYRVYGRSSGGQNQYFTVTAPTTTYTDTNTTGTVSNVPTGTGSVWQVKNSFEMKNLDTATIRWNIIENTWGPSQPGYCTVWTPANTLTGNPSTHLRNIIFRDNIVRHCAGGIQMSGRDVGTNAVQPSGQTQDISIFNNLFYDLDGPLYGGTTTRTIIVTSGPNTAYVNAGDTIAPARVSIYHNTFDQTNGNALFFFDLFKQSAAWHMDTFVLRDNIFKKGSNGLTGNNSCSQGNGCWTAYTSGASVVTKNVFADATASVYPNSANNFFPTSATLQSGYTDYTQQNFALKSTSTFHNAASDGTDVGANIATITAGTTIAITGDNSGSVVIANPPVITTTTLTSTFVGTDYRRTFTAAGGTGALTWARVSGALPQGSTLATDGTLSGTITAPGTASFIIQVTDAAGLTDSKAFTIAVEEVIIPAPRNTRLGWTEAKTFRRNSCSDDQDQETHDDLDVTLDEVAVGDLCFEFSSGLWKTVTATAPTMTLQTITRASSNLAFLSPGGTVTWTMSTTPNEFTGASRNRIAADLTGYSQCRIWSDVVVAAVGALTTVWSQYSTDGGSNWVDLGTTASTPTVALGSTGMMLGAYAPIADAAKGEVILRIWGVATGTPSTQPQVGSTGMNCK